MKYDKTLIAQMIEAVGTRPGNTVEDIHELVDGAVARGIGKVIVPLCMIPEVSERLAGTSTGIAVPLGAPFGIEESPDMKAFTAKKCIEMSRPDVTVDIDMVMNLLYFRAGMFEKVLQDIKAVRNVTNGHVLKVIIEAPSLSEEQIHTACNIVADAGADFVKTTTGNINGPTTLEMVETIHKYAGNRLQIKAAGGIDGLEMVEGLIDIGVTRIGMGYNKAFRFLDSISG